MAGGAMRFACCTVRRAYALSPGKAKRTRGFASAEPVPGCGLQPYPGDASAEVHWVQEINGIAATNFAANPRANPASSPLSAPKEPGLQHRNIPKKYSATAPQPYPETHPKLF